MSRHSRWIVLSAALCVVPFSAAQQAADPAAAIGEIENSKFQFEGEVNGNAVYVRSGPSDNDYATAKLDRGAKVTVVGLKYEWLKILPPEGSFCYVAKAFVEKRNDGSVGRVTNALNVRVGSSLLPMKTKVATKLEPGQDVQIIGEQEEYFKIKPPEGVYFYINKQFVDPVRRVQVPEIAAAETPVVEQTTTPLPVENRTMTADVPVAKAEPTEPPAADPAVQPAPAETIAQTPPETATVAAAPVAGAPVAAAPVELPSDDGPATQPATLLVSADIAFDQLEARLKEAAQLPIEQQPVAELLAGYQKLATDPQLPESMRRIADHRVQTLTVHHENHLVAVAHQRELADRDAKRRALEAEGEELMERIRTTGIVFYTAIGTLRPSTLQVGEGTLYRLTDPLTGRTLVYVRSDDPGMARMDGLFIGVVGEIVEDPRANLKFIAPTSVEQVDQRKVNRSVTARLTPPSLLPGGQLAQ